MTFDINRNRLIHSNNEIALQDKILGEAVMSFKIIIVVISVLFSHSVEADYLGWNFVNVCDNLNRGRVYIGSTREQDRAAEIPFVQDNLRALICQKVPFVKNTPLAAFGTRDKIYFLAVKHETRHWQIIIGGFAAKDSADGLLRDLGVSRQ